MQSNPIISRRGPHPGPTVLHRLRLDEVISKRNGLQVAGAPGHPNYIGVQ